MVGLSFWITLLDEEVAYVVPGIGIGPLKPSANKNKTGNMPPSKRKTGGIQLQILKRNETRVEWLR